MLFRSQLTSLWGTLPLDQPPLLVEFPAPPGTAIPLGRRGEEGLSFVAGSVQDDYRLRRELCD